MPMIGIGGGSLIHRIGSDYIRVHYVVTCIVVTIHKRYRYASFRTNLSYTFETIATPTALNVSLSAILVLLHAKL
jgi:hypothetical protein